MLLLLSKITHWQFVDRTQIFKTKSIKCLWSFVHWFCLMSHRTMSLNLIPEWYKHWNLTLRTWQILSWLMFDVDLISHKFCMWNVLKSRLVISLCHAQLELKLSKNLCVVSLLILFDRMSISFKDSILKCEFLFTISGYRNVLYYLCGSCWKLWHVPRWSGQSNGPNMPE